MFENGHYDGRGFYFVFSFLIVMSLHSTKETKCYCFVNWNFYVSVCICRKLRQISLRFLLYLPFILSSM